MMNEDRIIKETISESIHVKQKMSQSLGKTILKISQTISKTLDNGGTVYLFGNGGSAADSQHVAAELVGRFMMERRPLPAEAFTTNTSILTAIGNDYDFSEVFSRQVKAKVKPEDVVVGISTSGKSPNVLKAIKKAKSLGAITIGFTGSNPTEMKKITDICLCIPSKKTSRIQEAHMLVWHIVCDLVEKSITK